MAVYRGFSASHPSGSYACALQRPALMNCVTLQHATNNILSEFIVLEVRSMPMSQPHGIYVILHTSLQAYVSDSIKVN